MNDVTDRRLSSRLTKGGLPGQNSKARSQHARVAIPDNYGNR